MEPALCDVCKDVSLGKILIQTNLDTGEPEVSVVLLFTTNISVFMNLFSLMWL